MNRTISAPDRAILRQYPQTLTRYLCFAPRLVVYSAQADGPPALDAISGGIISLLMKNEVGDPADVLGDFTLDVGTTPGGFDIGQFRVRGLPNFMTHVLYVNETAVSSVPVANNHYLTIVREHRIWQNRIRRVINEDGISYSEFIDYDIAYGGENDLYYPPVANVTRNLRGDPYIPAGFTEPGESYRVVDLCSLLSFSKVNSITLIDWDGVPGGGFHVGDQNAPTIQLRLPVGYYELNLTVETDFGFARRYFPLWVFNRDGTGDQPITNFVPTSDQRGEGREMSFAIRSEIDLSVFPKGSAVCYWEEARFGDDEMPAQYIRSFLGWALQDVNYFRLFRSLYTIKVGGPQSWLNAIFGYAQTVYDPQGSDVLWIQMPNNTPDKMVHYLLRIYTTALQVMNLFFSNYEVPIEGYTSTNESVWTQITDVVKRYFGLAICDSIGSLYLNQYRFYLSQVERGFLPPMMDLDYRDWKDASPLELTSEKTEKYGLVDLYGENYDIVAGVDHSHVWRVWAPGLVQGIGTQSETGLPSIFLKTSEIGELQLRQYAGRHLARLNNPRPDNTLALKGNLDVFEIAWGLPITITYTEDNVRGEVIDHQEFMIKSISTSHSNTAPFKSMTISVEQVTGGLAGVNIDDVTQRDDVGDPTSITPVPPSPDGSYPLGAIAIAAHDPQAGWAYAFTPGTSFSWWDISPGKVGNGGPNVGNPWNPNKMWNFSSAGLEVLTITHTLDASGFSWANPFSLDDLYGMGATETRWALADHQTHGLVIAQGDNSQYIVSHDGMLTFTRYPGYFESMQLHPHNAGCFTGTTQLGQVNGVHWSYIQYWISTDEGASFSPDATNAPDVNDFANANNSHGSEIPYLRLDRTPNLNDSSMLIREWGWSRNGGTHGGHYLESTNKAAYFGSAPTGVGAWDNNIGGYNTVTSRKSTSSHTWNPNRRVWAIKDPTNLVWTITANISLDNGATIYSSSVLGFDGFDDEYVGVRFDGWPLSDPDDPTDGWWFAAAQSLVTNIGGGCKATANNGVDGWWGAQPSFFSHNGVSDFQATLIGKIPNLEEV